MKTFQDSAGRTWILSMTIDSVKRVRDLMQINLIEPEAGEPPLLTRLGSDDLLMLDVIYCLLKPQADELKVSDVDFARALGGDAVLAAINAFYEELTDFFQKRGRTDRAKGVATQHRLIQLAIQRVEMQMNRIDPEKVLDETVGK